MKRWERLCGACDWRIDLYSIVYLVFDNIRALTGTVHARQRFQSALKSSWTSRGDDAQTSALHAPVLQYLRNRCDSLLVFDSDITAFCRYQRSYGMYKCPCACVPKQVNWLDRLICLAFRLEHSSRILGADGGITNARDSVRWK